MARQLQRTDLRMMETPSAVYPSVVPPSVPKPTPPPDLEPTVVVSAEFYMGQVAAVLSLCRTNKLNYRAAVKQLETIVHNYEQNQ